MLGNDLSPSDLDLRMIICSSLLVWYEADPFLRRIVTAVETWNLSQPTEKKVPFFRVEANSNPYIIKELLRKQIILVYKQRRILQHNNAPYSPDIVPCDYLLSVVLNILSKNSIQKKTSETSSCRTPLAVTIVQ